MGNNKEHSFSALCQTIKTLRSKAGCPWDRKQNSTSLKKYIQEESEELLAAIQANDPENTREEIGDMMFLLILLSEIHTELKDFSIDDVLKGINEKMIRRHPHVFAGTPGGDEMFLKKQWEEIKSQEKAKKTN